MAVISTILTELRVDINDSSSTRYTDAMLLALFKKAIRRANRICQRNDIQFAKKEVALTTTANAYIDISSTVSDFDVWIGLYNDSSHVEIPMKNEREWEMLSSTDTALQACYLDQVNSKIYFKGTPTAGSVLTLWYYPTIDPSAYTETSSTPWNGRIDDILLEYVRMRALNMDEMDLTFDTGLMTDMENQILGAYRYNSVTRVDGSGWMGNI